MAARPKTRSQKEDVSRAAVLAGKLSRAAGNEDPALVAAAIVIFATENIKRSATDLREARAYLEGLRQAVDELLRNAFNEEAKPQRAARKS
jgi:hypothetical protein